MSIPPIENVDKVNTITFIGNDNTVTFETDSLKRYIIQFDGSDHIRFRGFNMVIDSTTEIAWVFHLKNEADSIEISYCDFNLEIGEDAKELIGVVASSSDISLELGNNANRTILKENLIKGGHIGINMQGSQDTMMIGPIIYNNTIIDFLSVGIESTFSINTKVKNNLVTCSSQAPPYENNDSCLGISFKCINSSFEEVKKNNGCKSFLPSCYIMNNQIYDFTYGGIFVENSYKSDWEMGLLILNNMISTENEGDLMVKAIFLNDVGACEVYHNSVHIEGEGESIIIEDNCTNLQLVSNSFSASENGIPFKLGSTNSLLIWDYNNYHNSELDQPIAIVEGIEIFTLEEFPLETNTFSISVNPEFFGSQDLHISETSGLKSKGNIELADKYFCDIDGDLRNTIIPDIGADQVGSALLVLNAKVWLQGAYQSDIQQMTNNLQINSLLPELAPYDTIPWDFAVNHASLSFPKNITDWVMIELLDSAFKSVEKQIAFINTKGYLMDVFGGKGVPFFKATKDTSYYVIIRHRNHLDIISDGVLGFQNRVIHDFTKPTNVLNGKVQLEDIGDGNFAMSAGDIDGNGVITVSDYNIYMVQKSLMNQYLQSDCSLDGMITVKDWNLLKENMSKIGVWQIRY